MANPLVSNVDYDEKEYEALELEDVGRVLRSADDDDEKNPEEDADLKRLFARIILGIRHDEDLDSLQSRLSHLAERMPPYAKWNTPQEVPRFWTGKVAREFVKRDRAEAMDFLFSHDKWKSGAITQGFLIGSTLPEIAVEENSFKCLQRMVSQKHSYGVYWIHQTTVETTMLRVLHLSRPDAKCFRILLESGRFGDFQSVNYIYGPLLQQVVNLCSAVRPDVVEDLREARRQYVDILLDEYHYPVNQSVWEYVHGVPVRHFNAASLLKTVLAQWGFSMFDHLVSKGADPRTIEDGQTLVQHLIDNPPYGIPMFEFGGPRREDNHLTLEANVRHLIEEHKIDAANLDSDGRDAFFSACVQCHVETARYLYLHRDNGSADPNRLDKNGETVLHILVSRQETRYRDTLEVVEFLLKETEASINVANSNGETVYDRAARMRLREDSWIWVLTPILDRAKAIFLASMTCYPSSSNPDQCASPLSRIVGQGVLELVWDYTTRGLGDKDVEVLSEEEKDDGPDEDDAMTATSHDTEDDDDDDDDDDDEGEEESEDEKSQDEEMTEIEEEDEDIEK